ncbi:hypothetical protein [Luteimonas deserti]|uniref:DUF5808 domain-containing protein n=1 Tax=Luteimonas deserti TaxID=2752306 RepID=A0A7Z0QTT4_9GAMM|nr:hypothetical protein [Luteimonas deserti]NYZ63692.1 hypothetical protein [Luteimonas deserti]
MDRNERNARAWQSPDNWIGPRWLGLYRAADDDRLWVPKVPRVLGWTINLAKPVGVAMLVILIVTPLGIMGGYAMRG